MSYYSVNGTGKPINSMSAVVPIIKEYEKGILQTIGTGFYLTRYGLVVTASHVIKGLASKNKSNLTTCFVCHPLEPNRIILRKILSTTYMTDFDIGILQADNYCEKYPQNPLQNLRVRINPIIPLKGEKLVTYAFPENEEMDFTDKNNKRIIKGDFYSGKFLKFVDKSENPFIPYPYFETTIKIKSGASGGPVFHNNKVIGINCRGWDFGNDIPDDDNLSSIVPISYLFPMKIKLIQLPEVSWEYKQLTEEQRNDGLTIEELIKARHIFMN